MIIYQSNVVIIGEDEKLVAKKLADCNGNADKCCSVCSERENLYSVEYALSTNTDFIYGVHCEKCMRRIFRIKGE